MLLRLSLFAVLVAAVLPVGCGNGDAAAVRGPGHSGAPTAQAIQEEWRRLMLPTRPKLDTAATPISLNEWAARFCKSASALSDRLSSAQKRVQLSAGWGFVDDPRTLLSQFVVDVERLRAG